jgi:hypothetical protein
VTWWRPGAGGGLLSGVMRVSVRIPAPSSPPSSALASRPSCASHRPLPRAAESA